MKKITLLALLALNITSFAQQKSTGNVTLSNNMTANLTLNNNTSKVTLVLTGPSDRWFALQFLTVSAMSLGEDLVYSNATTLVDANFSGNAAGPGRVPAVDGNADTYPNCFPFTFHDSGEYTDSLTLTDHFAIALTLSHGVSHANTFTDPHTNADADGGSDSLSKASLDEHDKEIGHVDKVQDGSNCRN